MKSQIEVIAHGYACTTEADEIFKATNLRKSNHRNYSDSQKTIMGSRREGFAHGFLTLSETAEFLYKMTNYYSTEHEQSIVWDDVDIGINWNINTNINPTLSEKDCLCPTLNESEVFTQ